MPGKATFLICDICGMMVELIFDGGAVMECCNEPMRILKSGTVDAALEKHVPALKRESGKLVVDVGTVEHPMAEDHYIEWIQVCQGDRTWRKMLKPGDKPRAEFCVPEGPVQVYAYCNKHGLWEASL